MSDYSSMSIGSMASAMDAQTFGAQVVTKTLDYMNQHQSSGQSNSNYDFQKSVLGAWASGAIVNNLV